MKIKLVTWDIQDTLISSETLRTPQADRVIRGNCLQLIKEEPVLPLIDNVEEVMAALKNYKVYQGIASSYAYQYGNNYLSASKARDYIDPRLIILANKFAWEGHVLENKNWDEVLEPYLKPRPTMLNLAKNELEKILGIKVDAQECVHIGDTNKDRGSAENAGWEFYDIKEIRGILECLI